MGEAQGVGMRIFMIWTLSLGVLAGMVLLCVLWRDWGGLVGLALGALGFLVRYFEPHQRDTGERLGNGYAGAILGLSVGFALGAIGYYVAAHYQEWWL